MLWVPLGPAYGFYSQVNPQAFALNQATDAAEFIAQWPSGYASDPLTRVGFSQGTLTGTAPTYRVSIQGVDGSGNPDGVIKAGGLAYVDYTPTSGNNNTWQWRNLGATYQPSAGEWIAKVIAHISGTIDGSNFSSFRVHTNLPSVGGHAYYTQNDNGTRSRSTSIPIFAFGTATRPFGFPLSAAASVSFNLNSTPDEQGMAFTIGGNGTYNIDAVRWYPLASTAGQVVNVNLYDGTTLLQSVPFDTDFGAANRLLTCFFDEVSLSTLNFGSQYRVALAPQSASNHNLSGIDVASAADFDAYHMQQTTYASGRTDGGAWADTLTRKFFMEVRVVNPSYSGGGSGSLLTTGGMSGGMRG